VGLNYKAHAAEGSYKDQDLPPYPTLFGRWTASLSVGHVPVPVPAGEDGLDWEGEVAAYIGRRVESADEAEAADSVFGYSTFNDLTARRAQKLTTQWTLGKNGDFTGPLGPLVSQDEVGDLRDGLQVRTRVNGTEVQNGNTRDMIFSVPAIISLISQTLTLHPGDVIATGTPEGVGYARTPQWLLQPGDTVEVEIDKLGTLATPVGGPSLRSRA
jgi:2-keto-4-pentenoate hydratase/2-oxohepta-3-ene-1,7-dioic acid hydratase in catechol pathway